MEFVNTESHCCRSSSWTWQYAAKVAPFAVFTYWQPHIANIASLAAIFASYHDNTKDFMAQRHVRHIHKHAMEGELVGSLALGLVITFYYKRQPTWMLLQSALVAAIQIQIISKQFSGHRLGR